MVLETIHSKEFVKENFESFEYRKLKNGGSEHQW